jgi:hypothetical protein
VIKARYLEEEEAIVGVHLLDVIKEKEDQVGL